MGEWHRSPGGMFGDTGPRSVTSRWWKVFEASSADAGDGALLPRRVWVDFRVVLTAVVRSRRRGVQWRQEALRRAIQASSTATHAPFFGGNVVTAIPSVV